MVALRYVTQIWSCNYLTDSQEKTKDDEERKRKKEKKKNWYLDPISLNFLQTSPNFRTGQSVGRMHQGSQNSKLDPVSRVTGIPGWYWIRGIKCSDTTRVGLVY